LKSCLDIKVVTDSYVFIGMPYLIHAING